MSVLKEVMMKKPHKTLNNVLYKNQIDAKNTHTNKNNIRTKYLQMWAFKQMQWATIEFILFS